MIDNTRTYEPGDKFKYTTRYGITTYILVDSGNSTVMVIGNNDNKRYVAGPMLVDNTHAVTFDELLKYLGTHFKRMENVI